MHDDALAVGADDQDLFLGTGIGERLQRPTIKGIEVLAQMDRHFLGLALPHPPSAQTIQMRNRLIERSANDLLDKLFAHAVRVFVRRQVQLRVQREYTLKTPRPITPPSYHHLSEAGFQAP